MTTENQEATNKPGAAAVACTDLLAEASSLYDAACLLMRMRHQRNNENLWTNLQNAAMQFNAAKQARRNALIRQANVELTDRRGAGSVK
jgi:5-methylcytosine-specific restriction endonuclease McrA